VKPNARLRKRARPPRALPAGPRVGTTRPKVSARSRQTREVAGLRLRLADSMDMLRAIRSGEVDTVTVAGKLGSQVFTLTGAEQAYRTLIESMNEGALTLTLDKTILYANQCFAKMVRSPLEQVTGGSFRRYLSAPDRASLRALLKRAAKLGSKLQVNLLAVDGTVLPVLISVRPLARNGAQHATVGMVVTDMTEARRSEDRLRNLTHRLVQSQEAERGHVALELHDRITQLLCAVLVRSQALADKLSGRDGPLRNEAVNLREMLGQTAEIVERISRNLRPGVLDELGLAAALRETTLDFTKRTGVPVTLPVASLTVRLPAEIELTLFRILQEALKNVENHARAHQVTVSLSQQGSLVQLTVRDDGIGFSLSPSRNRAHRKGKSGVGLLSMRERATYVGGVLKITSARRSGTEIAVRIPLPAGIPVAD
jgi:two-component system NarL family sensor kinase